MLAPLTTALFDERRIRHGFFTRQGGVSDGIYASLNCGLGSRDVPANVIENRARVAIHLGGREPVVLSPYQVHGADVVVVDRVVARGSLPKADAIVTATPGLVIGILTADCVPVLLADAEAGIVAAAHAGWRGAVAGVTDRTIEAMERLGARRAHIAAAIGPAIQQANYEVGVDFMADRIGNDGVDVRFFAVPALAGGEADGREADGRPHFDLPAYVADRLARFGVETIESIRDCTCEREDHYFSFRRATKRQETDYGRQISAIVVT
ncbi:MAG: peptidoglycan editing factor PgeF [Hyphomicrobiaceae bacterium]|nr:peptidoglycan editing factor PgeF [Hyphomicrobiaceae bacterium]